MARDPARSSESPASFRRLLSSHHSIYNTLTDPLLECTLPPLGASRGPFPKSLLRTVSRMDDDLDERLVPLEIRAPPLDDPLASFLSWQSINISLFHDITRLVRLSSPLACSQSRPASASILSNSTDEDAQAESLVLVPSLKQHVSPLVLLFETDEEDGADEEAPFAESPVSGKLRRLEDRPPISSSTSQRQTSVGSDRLQTFIMPRMLLSDEIGSARLTIVSSASVALDGEIQGLAAYVQHSLPIASSRLTISRVSLERAPLLEEILMTRNSDMVLVINDGCTWLSVLTKSVVDLSGKGTLPAFTVVNLLTSDYFASLFDIISSLRPAQVIKSPSLSNKTFLERVRGIVEKELNRRKSHSNCAKATPKTHEANMDSHHSFVLSSSAIKTDYRHMEKKIRHEMVFAPEYHAVDPLQITSGLGHLNVLIGSLNAYFVCGSCGSTSEKSSSANRETLWIVCTFSLGIGLGFTLSALQVFKAMKATLFLDASPNPVAVKHPNYELSFHTISDAFTGLFDQMGTRINDMLQNVLRKCSSSGILSEGQFEAFLHESKSTGSAAIHSAANGYYKIKALIHGWTE
ncbi:hypothetical protein METBIDRAFT_11812 [Metschnikowia bicuspidata var. bicuspidata NRRL YB-4993]|uniref:Uncharacterized protein n=1 Tax=Metschnikowia bicuspidata var. bicuspidata NRRL YB-4993 TaxID=869754 RepID=A0A1A0HBJ5_9ASCO|nr:hypothetical protein METBIDRAFT_11812 [Metschnikowia bicuspidata var. bicuspidata NRRL YB-4993]OBA21258.1 hypothetical protein METBIDRAFT_11812 [Metschnikowia bicuspidata var. bicuspidata NRRL YB-4993]